MKTLLGAFCLAVALAAPALADHSTSPGYTAFDQAQFAKLAAGNGTWVCKDTPPSTKPDVVTGKQAGNWYVLSETGDQPNITYVRWNHTLKAFTQIEVDQAGSSEIFTTSSADPYNATWKPVFPPGSGLYPYALTSSGSTFTANGKYKDAKTGKVMSYTGICTKH